MLLTGNLAQTGFERIKLSSAGAAILSYKKYNYGDNVMRRI